MSDIFLKCETGRITGLLGRNGEGKSCLMNIIYGTLQCMKSVRIDRVAQNKAFTRPDLLVYLPQFNFIPGKLSLKSVFIDYALDYSKFEKQFSGFSDKYNLAINRLSGGERRLVELYVIAKRESQFIMLDEPFTHLNPVQTENVLNFLVQEKHHKGFLITDHMLK